MPISFACPVCGKKLKISSKLAGKACRCAHCKQPFKAPALLPDAEEHVVAGRPPLGAGQAVAPALGESGSLPVPVIAKSGLRSPMVLGGAIALLLVLIGGAVGGWLWLKNRAEAVDNLPTAADATRPGAPGNSLAQDSIASISYRPLTPEQINRRLLKSAAWVIVPGTNRTKWGSGVLVHKHQKLVLTCYHLVGDDRRAVVFFPDYRNNEPITAPQHYIDDLSNNGKLGLKATVVWTEAGKDLALLKLEDAVPDRIQEVRVARKSASSGQGAFSIGASGVRIQDKHADGMLWRYTRGDVRGAYRDHLKYDDGQTVNASLVETSSEINPGDSGGPIVNDRVELIGVVAGQSKEQRAVAKNIDALEVDAMMRVYFQKEVGQEWEPGPGDPGTRLADELTALVRKLQSPDATTRLQATNRLAEMEAEAQAAIARLLPLLRDKDPDVARAAAVALDRIGTPALVDLPVLHKALEDEDARTRNYAARMLARTDMMTRDGLPVMLVAAGDKDATVRENAVVALGNFGDGWRTSLPKFIQMAGDEKEDRTVKMKILAATQNLVMQLKPFDRSEFVKFFKGYLTDQKHAEVRTMATTVLAKFVSEEFRDLLPTLLPVLKDDDEDVRRDTLKALKEPGVLAKVPKDNVPAVLEAMKSDHAETRRFAYPAIGKFLPEVREALPLLIRAMQDKDPEVRESAVQGLHSFGADARDAVPALLAALKMPDSSTTLRRLAVETLALIGRHAEMVSGLCLAMEDKDADVRLRAEDALVKLEVTKDDVPVLVKGLENPSSVLVRANAADALGKLGAEAGAAVPALTVALKDKELAVRIRAARTLGKIGSQARVAVPLLAGILVEKLPDGPGTTSLRTTVAGLSPEGIYQRTLKSSVWILVRTQRGLATGSGSLIHLPHRLALTNYHVVGSATAVRVFFPHYENNELITKPSYYVDKESKLGLTGTVLARDATRDLALLTLDRLPPGALALPLAAQSPLPNQNLFSIGASGAFDGVLWRSTTGQVRQVYYNDKMVYSSGQQVRARVVETQSPINAGDSGGPIVNERGEQVAVVNANRRGEQLLSYGIDITEVRAFLKEASQSHGLNLDNATYSARESLGGSASELRDCAVTALGQIGPDAEAAVPVLREALNSKDGTVRASAIVALGAIGPNAKKALVSLVLELLKPESRDLVVESLAKIGTDPDSVDTLIDQLYKRDAEIKIGVAQALGKIGAPARKAAIRLGQVWKSDKDPRVKQAAREAQQRVQQKP